MRPVMRAALTLSLVIPLSAMADGISIGIGTPPPLDIVITPSGDNIDVNWGSSGYVTLNTQTITAQALDKRGRLLVAGYSPTSSIVTRLLANGQPDTSFGSGGARAITSFDANVFERPTSIIPLADGSMLVVINRVNLMSLPWMNQVIHVSASGGVNATYGGEGRAQFDGMVRQAFRDSQGRLYLLNTNGVAHEETGKKQWWLRRVLSNGQADVDFGEEGVLALPDAISLVMTQRVGEIVQVRHSDADNGCDSSVLDIADDVVVGSFCSGDTGYPISLFSAPDIGSPNPETVIAWNTTDTSAPPEAATVIFGSQAHALGFFYNFSADRIDLVNAVTPSETLPWIFSSEAHAARINNGLLLLTSAQTDGSMVMSSNSTDCADGVFICAPSTLFKGAGLSLDLTPDAPATAPSITFDGLHYASEPLLITGLTNYTSAPVRIVGGEISLDGETWLSGWAWVHNNSEVRIRYLDEATVTVGGIIAPANPTLAVGDVVTLQFNGSSARLVDETAGTGSGSDDGNLNNNDKGGSSGGGSIDWAWFTLLGLALAGRRLRRTAAR